VLEYFVKGESYIMKKKIVAAETLNSVDAFVVKTSVERRFLMHLLVKVQVNRMRRETNRVVCLVAEIEVVNLL
jgi:hypothetical protein